MAFNARDLAVNGVRALQPYQPGKPIEELERDLGLTGIVKLASNENPRTSRDVIAKALAEHGSEVSRYPDGFRIHPKTKTFRVAWGMYKPTDPW